MDFDGPWLAERVQLLIPLWLSLSVHEWAHAWSAWRLGDDTAARLGRMTINPLAHIDPIGTLLLPLLGIPFGWAKPVPVQPHRFDRRFTMRTGMMITAAAGPIANLCLVAASMVLLACWFRFWPEDVGQRGAAGKLLFTLMFVNVILASFNALPIPPLDGSRVADALMPAQLRPLWEEFCRLGPFALAAVIILPRLVGVNLYYWPMKAASFLLGQLLMLVGSG